MDLIELAKDFYRAFERGDRAWTEAHLAEGYTFTSPYDDRIDRDAMFARCWANREHVAGFHFEAVAQDGDVVLVLYRVLIKGEGPPHSARNAECLRFEGGKLKSTEVFFGDPPPGLTRAQFSRQSGAG